jgi:hypothetical protein
MVKSLNQNIEKFGQNQYHTSIIMSKYRSWYNNSIIDASTKLWKINLYKKDMLEEIKERKFSFVIVIVENTK